MTGGNCENGSAYNHTIATLGGIGEQQAGVGNAIAETPVSGSYAAAGGKRGFKGLRFIPSFKKLPRLPGKFPRFSGKFPRIPGKFSLTKKIKGGDCGCDNKPSGGDSADTISGGLIHGGKRSDRRKSTARSYRKSRKHRRSSRRRR